MADTDTEKTILLTLELDKSATEKRIVEIVKVLDALKTTQAQVTEEYKTGKISQDVYIANIEKLRVGTTVLNKELAQHRKELVNASISQKSAAGSLNDLKAKLSNATAAYNALSEAERENVDIGGKLAQHVKSLSDTLKEAEELTGLYTRSVGDYAKPYKEAGESITELKDALSEAEEAFAGLTEEERKNEQVGGAIVKRMKAIEGAIEDANKAAKPKSIKEYLENLELFGTSVGDAKEALGGSKEAFDTFTKGINVSKGALIAFGAVPILILLTGLVALLTKSQKGMDFLAKAFKAGELALTALTDGFVRIGEAVLDAFTSWEKFTNLLTKTNEISRETTLNMIAAAKAGADIAQAQQDLEESEINLIRLRARNAEEIERQKKLSEDVTKSTKVREAAVLKANKLEEESLTETNKQQQKKVDLLKQEIALRGDNATRAQRKELAEQEAILAENAADSIGRTTELQNNLNSIREEGIAKAKRAEQLAAAEAISGIEAQIVIRKRYTDDTLKLEEQLLRAQAKSALIALKNSQQDGESAKTISNQKRLIEVKLQADIYQLRVTKAAEAMQKVLAIEETGINASLSLTRAGSKEELNLQIEAENKRRQQQQVENKKTLDQQKQVAENELKGDKNKKERLDRLQKLNEDYAVKETEIMNASNRKIDDMRAAYNQAEVERQSELRKIGLEAEVDLFANSLEARREYDRDIIDEEEKTQIALINLSTRSEEDKNQLAYGVLAKGIARRRELDRQIREDQLSAEQNLNDVKLSLVRAGTSEELKLRLKAIQLERDQQLNQAGLTLEARNKIVAEADKAQLEANKEFNRQLTANITDSVESATGILSRIYEAQIQAATNALDKQQKAAERSAGANADLREKIEARFQKKREKLEKDAAEKRQRIASIENIIGTARAVTQAQILPPPFNVIQTALAIATGIAQQAVIESQKFAKGGVAGYYNDYMSNGRGAFLKDGPGTTVSDSITAKLSKGESIINAKATTLYFDELSAINASTGGDPFPGAKQQPAKTIPKVSGFRYGMIGVGENQTGELVAGIVKGINEQKVVLVAKDYSEVEDDINRTNKRVTVGL